MSYVCDNIYGCMYKCIISVLTSTINAFAASYHMIASSKVPFDSNVSVLITHPWSPSFLGDKIWVCVKDTTAPCQAIYRKLDYHRICCVFWKNINFNHQVVLSYSIFKKVPSELSDVSLMIAPFAMAVNKHKRIALTILSFWSRRTKTTSIWIIYIF